MSTGDQPVDTSRPALAWHLTGATIRAGTSWATIALPGRRPVRFQGKGAMRELRDGLFDQLTAREFGRSGSSYLAGSGGAITLTCDGAHLSLGMVDRLLEVDLDHLVAGDLHNWLDEQTVGCAAPCDSLRGLRAARTGDAVRLELITYPGAVFGLTVGGPGAMQRFLLHCAERKERLAREWEDVPGATDDFLVQLGWVDRGRYTMRISCEDGEPLTLPTLSRVSLVRLARALAVSGSAPRPFLEAS